MSNKKKSGRYYDLETSQGKKDKSQQVQVFSPDLSKFMKPRHNYGLNKKDGKKLRHNHKDGTSKKDGKDYRKKKGPYALSHGGVKKPLAKKKGQYKTPKERKEEKLKKKKEQPQKLREPDPFPGDAPIDKSKIKKYKRGSKMDLDSLRTKYHKQKYEAKEAKYKAATKQAARTELLLREEAGFLEADNGELTCEVGQRDITEAVDINSAQKFFELKLDKFGPYRMNYTRNGRHLLLGGNKGHIAALDWQTKKLMCEINVMETVQDIQWLHIETMFAVAQKRWTYIYDNQGVELHCLKILDQVLRLEFLPFHFLMATVSAPGYINWIDISVGQKVAGFNTNHGRTDVMCQNPSNAVIHLGHAGGTVTLWSPNVKEPLVKMLCHGGGTRSVAVHHNGNYMATSGIDRTLKIWDLRMYKKLYCSKIGVGAGSLSFSQRGLLSAGLGNIVEVYRDPCQRPIVEPYMSHRVKESIQNLQFCPYEDVLGVGHSAGFASLLIPGAGEPNFDALEANPYQSRKQRQQAEVKMLLEKLQPEMIGLDTAALGQVDTKTLKEVMEEKSKLMYLKPQKIDFEPKYKKKGKSKTGKLEQRKKGVQFEHKRQQIKEFMKEKQKKNPVQPRKDGVFDRFRKKDT